MLGSDEGVSAFLDEFMTKMGLSQADSQIDSVYVVFISSSLIKR